MRIWLDQAAILDYYDVQSIRRSLDRLAPPWRNPSVNMSINDFIDHNVGVANFVDSSDSSWWYHEVHPRDKSEVAHRIALNIRQRLYESTKQLSSEQRLIDRGPMLWFSPSSIVEWASSGDISSLSDIPVDLLWPLPQSIFVYLVGERPDPSKHESPNGSINLLVSIKFPPFVENRGLYVKNTGNCQSCCDGSSSSLITITINHQSNDEMGDHSTHQTTLYHLPNDLSIGEFSINATFSVPFSQDHTMDKLFDRRVWIVTSQVLQVGIGYHNCFAQCALYNFAGLPMLPISRPRTVTPLLGSLFEHSPPVTVGRLALFPEDRFWLFCAAHVSVFLVVFAAGWAVWRHCYRRIGPAVRYMSVPTDEQHVY
jgi:hypothetical protein